MQATAKSSFLILLASLVFLLLGPAQAELSCQDMPCCTSEKVSTAPSAEYSCSECKPKSCECSIQSSTPEGRQNEQSLSFNFRFDIECQECTPEIDVLPTLEPSQPVNRTPEPVDTLLLSFEAVSYTHVTLPTKA